MAINPNIALQGQPVNMLQAIQGGLKTGEMIRQSGMRDAIMRQQVQSGEQTIQDNRRVATEQKGLYINQLASSLAQLPVQERAGALARAIPQMQQMGIDPKQIADQDLSDQGLQQVIAATQPFAQQSQQGNRFQFGASRVVEQDGKLFFATDKRDPQSGQIETVMTPVPGELADQLGRTTQDRVGERVQTQQQVGDVEQEQKISTARTIAEIERKNKKYEDLDAAEVGRLQKSIEGGLAAASALPDVTRGLELLEKVNTGGMTALAKNVTDFFGTTSGDVGELNNILASRVLEGLQAFSGAISEKELDFVRSMETSLAQGKEVNRAQLNRLGNMYKREIATAKKAAGIAGDEFALERLNAATEAEPVGFGATAPAGRQGSKEIPQSVRSVIPQGMSAGERLPDGRYEVLDAQGNLIGHVEP